MKPMGKILEETTIESSVGVAETIEKLRQQQGPCSDEDSLGYRKWFYCSKKGAIRFTNGSGDYGNDLYFVEGRVLEQDGKTLVKIYSLKSRMEFFDRWFTIILGIIFIIAIAIIAIITKQIFTKETLILLAVYAFSAFFTAYNMRHRKKNKDFDIKVMKNEIIERVEAIKRWDD